VARELYDYQNRAIDELRQALRERAKRPLLQAPTGAGKTVIACRIIQNALEKGKRVYFCVPALALIEQTFSDFFRQGIYSLGVIQANHPQTNASRMCQIISIQTLSRRNVAVPDIMIVDEAHRRDKHISALMRDPAWEKVVWIGLSATPWAKGLGQDYDRKITVTTTAELIEAGRLSPFRVFAPTHPDLTGVATIAGDYHEGQLSAVMSSKKIVGDVVENWLKLGESRPTLCFCVDRGHANAVHESFKAAGVASAYQDANTPPDERRDIRDKFKSGEIRVVCNIGTLTTGVDWDVRCIILARPTKSEMLYVQIIGRGLRTAPGKADCLARDTLVLTDRGEVKIQALTLDHKVWDGVSFVPHAGAVCKGVQQVIEYDGVSATPDHRVMTREGWMEIAEAARRELGIARTGICGMPIRLPENHIPARDGCGSHAEGDCGALAPSLVQTEREVWDVLDAGPLQRFTANGRLVHNCLIIDHSDTTLNLGFVTDIFHDELDDGTKRGAADRTAPEDRVEPLPKPCTSCGALKSPRVRACPACGFEPKKRDTTHVLDGELRELGLDKNGPKNSQIYTVSEKEFWFTHLRRYQTDHGYADGWCANKYREKFGVWPQGMKYLQAAEFLDPVIAAWIRSRNIAWAKSRNAAMT
jgi:superfamily II DNA or RNA helicase